MPTKPKSTESSQAKRICDFINGDCVGAIPAKWLRTEVDTRNCFFQILDSSNGILKEATRRIQFNSPNKIKWQELATILRTGLQYALIYRHYQQCAEHAESHDVDVFGRTDESIVDVLRYAAALLDKRPIPLLRAAAGQVGCVADDFEANVKAKSSLKKRLRKIAANLPARTWLFLAESKCFVAFSVDNKFSDAASNQVDRAAIENLFHLCFDNALAMIGMHPSYVIDDDIIEAQVQRPYVLVDPNLFTTWIRIPRYYKYSHLKQGKPDFHELKFRLKDREIQRPQRLTRARKLQLVKELVAQGKTKEEAVAELGYKWTEESIIKRFGTPSSSEFLPPLKKCGSSD